MKDGRAVKAGLLNELEGFLHEKIPVTGLMGVAVESSDEERLVLTAPLDVNHNHLGTAFGGSLASVAILAGYTLLWSRIGESGTHIVIRESQTRYLRAVTKNIRAICEVPDPAVFDAFMRRFREKGKARIHIRVTVDEDDATCVEFTGEYVAVAPGR